MRKNLKTSHLNAHKKSQTFFRTFGTKIINVYSATEQGDPFFYSGREVVAIPNKVYPTIAEEYMYIPWLGPNRAPPLSGLQSFRRRGCARLYPHSREHNYFLNFGSAHFFVFNIKVCFNFLFPLKTINPLPPPPLELFRSDCKLKGSDLFNDWLWQWVLFVSCPVSKSPSCFQISRTLTE